MADASKGGDKADVGVEYDSSGTDSDDELDMTRPVVHGEDSSDDEEDDVLDVDFDFVDPKEIHFKSVRRLLARLLPGEERTFDTAGLSDLIVAQASVGTMVTVPQEGDTDAYAFATVLNVSRHAATPSLKAVRKYLLSKAPAGTVRKALEAAFDATDGGTGLLLSERMLNMPPEVAPTLYQCLQDDLAWATQHEIDAAHREQFDLKRFIMICPCFLDKETPTAPPAKRARPDAGSDSDSEGGDDMPPPPSTYTERFLHFEEELFDASATISFPFSVEATADAAGGSALPTPGGAPSRRRVILFPASVLPQAVQSMTGLLAAATTAAQAEADAWGAGESAGGRKRPLPAALRASKMVVTPAQTGGAGQGGQ